MRLEEVLRCRRLGRLMWQPGRPTIQAGTFPPLPLAHRRVGGWESSQMDTVRRSTGAPLLCAVVLFHFYSTFTF